MTEKETPHIEQKIVAESGSVIKDVQQKVIIYQYPPPGVPRMAPPLPSRLVVRETELLELRDLLQQKTTTNVIAIHGMGGLGKTTIAIMLCHEKQMLEAYPDGILWASLGKSASIANRQQAWATALGYGDEFNKVYELEDRAALLRSWLYKKKCLLVIDDVWETANLPLLQVGGPECATLITTRLRKVAQKVGKIKNLNELSPAKSVELLRKWAHNDSEDDAESAIELAKRLGYLPLALTLAGAQVTKSMSWSKLLASFYEEGISLLDLDDPTERDESLALAFDISLKQLPKDIQKKFTMLGVFATGPDAPFDSKATSAIWNISENDGKKALDRLVRSALLGNNKNTYTIHPLLGEYAASKMDLEIRLHTEESYRTYYFQVAEQSEYDWETVDINLSQIQNARRYTDQANAKELFDWSKTLSSYFSRRGLWKEKIEWLEDVYTIAKESHNYSLAATCKNDLGHTYKAIDQFKLAQKHYEDSLAIRTNSGDIAGKAATLDNLGQLYSSLGNMDDALVYYQQSLEIRETIYDIRGMAYSLNNIGSLFQFRGDYKEAMDYYNKCLPLLQEIHDHGNEAITLQNMGNIQHRRGKIDEALNLFERSLNIHYQRGDKVNIARLHTFIGDVYEAEDNHAKAIEHLLKSEKIQENLNLKTELARTNISLAMVYRSQGNEEKGIACNEKALKLSREVENPYYEANAIMGIGITAYNQGKLTKALEKFKESIQIFSRIGNRAGECNVLVLIAVVYYNMRNIEKAISVQEQAVIIADKLGIGTQEYFHKRLDEWRNEQNQSSDWGMYS